MRILVSIVIFHLAAFSFQAQSITETPQNSAWVEVTVDPDIAQIPSTPRDSIESLDPVRFVWKPAQEIHSGRLFVNPQGNRHHLLLEKEHVSELPILSLYTDQNHLFDQEEGIYVPGVHWTAKRSLYSGNYQQRGREWERPVSLSYYEHGRLAFQTTCGLRTHGLLARSAPQKSLRLCARTELDANGLSFDFFGHTNTLPYLLLRSPFSSHSGNVIADMVVHNVAEHTGLAHIDFQPVAVHLNGVYWGLMSMRPRPDESFLAEFHGVDSDQVFLDDQFQDSSLQQLAAFIDESVPIDNIELDSISRLLDLANFSDYMILETFFRNLDWAGNNNVQFYRIENGPLHLALIDLDATFQVEEQDMFTHIKEKNSYIHKIWSALCANAQFATSFSKRYEELVSKCLNTKEVTASIDSISTLVAPEIEAQILRWNYPERHITWQESLRDMRIFALNRPHYAATHLNREFGQDSVEVPELKSTVSIVTQHILEQYKIWIAGFFVILIAIGTLLVFKRE